jgi:hypothetical protein
LAWTTTLRRETRPNMFVYVELDSLSYAT